MCYVFVSFIDAYVLQLAGERCIGRLLCTYSMTDSLCGPPSRKPHYALHPNCPSVPCLVKTPERKLYRKPKADMKVALVIFSSNLVLLVVMRYLGSISYRERIVVK